MRRLGAGAIAVVALGLAGCTQSAAPEPPPTDSTITSTITATRTAKPTYVPPPAKTLAALPPGRHPAKGEVEKLCPYIRTGLNMDPTSAPNVASIVGSRVYRTTVITTTKPVGCRFWFYSDINYAIADIVPGRFRTPADAHNAMVLTAEAGKDSAGRPDIVPGVDAVIFRTKFLGRDGDRDWACAFAAGDVMVVVRTARFDDGGFSALNLAKAVAKKF